MTKAAIYARYSSDNQREASIEDQFRLCREYAERQGWQVVESYSDRAISGASLLRPGIQTGLENRKIALERELEIADEPPPLLHPNMAKVYSGKINALYAALQSDEGRPTAADLLRTLIDRIVLEPADGKLDILIKGDIAGILSFASAEKELPATAIRGRQVPMVAGVGFEPTTFRL